MNRSLASVLETIKELGGEQSADLLAKIFHEEFFYAREADLRKSLEDLWEGLSADNHGGLFSQTGGFNLIPAKNNNGTCSRLCMTIIPRGFRGGGRFLRNGFQGNHIGFEWAILLQSAYWFHCMHINQENIIITPDWDQEDFEERYEPVIRSYEQSHNKKIFVLEVAKRGLILRYPY